MLAGASRLFLCPHHKYTLAIELGQAGQLRTSQVCVTPKDAEQRGRGDGVRENPLRHGAERHDGLDLDGKGRHPADAGPDRGSAAAVSTGNSYNQKFDRIALAFIKIDKDQVLPKNARDNSTEVNTAAQNWVEVNGWDHDDPGHASGPSCGPGSLASGNIFPQDKVLNQATGASWEQRVGNLARRNKPQEDFQMCLLELFDYYDYKGSWDQRPADEEYFLLQEGTPRNPPPSMPALMNSSPTRTTTSATRPTQ